MGRDPATYKEAIKAADAEEWTEACEYEMDALSKNDTWELVELPPGRKAVKSKWVFKIEDRLDVIMPYGVYGPASKSPTLTGDETFSPVARFVLCSPLFVRDLRLFSTACVLPARFSLSYQTYPLSQSLAAMSHYAHITYLPFFVQTFPHVHFILSLTYLRLLLLLLPCIPSAFSSHRRVFQALTCYPTLPTFADFHDTDVSTTCYDSIFALLQQIVGQRDQVASDLTSPR